MLKEILTALFKHVYKAMALWGCSYAGVALTIEDLKDI